MSSLRGRDAETCASRGPLDATGEFNTGPRVEREQQVAVQVDVIAEARDLRGGGGPETGLHPAGEDHAQAEGAGRVHHPYGLANAARLRELDRHAVRDLGAGGDVG